MVYVSPAVSEMVSQKADELEGKDFFDLVFGQSPDLLSRCYVLMLLSSGPAPVTESSHLARHADTAITASTKLQLCQHVIHVPDTTCDP